MKNHIKRVHTKSRQLLTVPLYKCVLWTTHQLQDTKTYCGREKTDDCFRLRKNNT